VARTRVPSARYDHDVAGMPVFAATEPLQAVVSDQDMIKAVPTDDELCALALACKRQFASPYVSIGRSRSDIAMPHPEGVTKPDYGDTKWAVIRFRNSRKAKEIIIAVDTARKSPEPASSTTPSGPTPMPTGTVATFLPQKTSLLPEVKRERNKQFRTNKGTRVGTKSGQRKGVVDHLTELGVRTLTGQRER
jgi:hypothetical protein